MSSASVEIDYIGKGDPPRCPANPAFPDGKDIVLSTTAGGLSCRTELPYPARGIGYWRIKCNTCGLHGLVTCAGRRDDPRSVTHACKIEASSQTRGPRADDGRV